MVALASTISMETLYFTVKLLLILSYEIFEPSLKLSLVTNVGSSNATHCSLAIDNAGSSNATYCSFPVLTLFGTPAPVCSTPYNADSSSTSLCPLTHDNEYEDTLCLHCSSIVVTPYGTPAPVYSISFDSTDVDSVNTPHLTSIVTSVTSLETLLSGNPRDHQLPDVSFPLARLLAGNESLATMSARDDDSDPEETTQEPIPFLVTWITSLGEDPASPKGLSIIELCQRIGIYTMEDLELIAPDMITALPPGCPPVVAYRLHQFLHSAQLLGESKMDTFANFNARIRTFNSPPTPAMESSSVSPELTAKTPQRTPSVRQKSFSTRVRSSEFFVPQDFQPALDSSITSPGESMPWGALPPLLLPRDREYRAAFGEVDPFAGDLNREAGRVEAKMREKLLASAVSTILTFSGRRTGFIRWRNGFVESMTSVGRAAVLEPDYVAKATASGISPQDIAISNRFVYSVLKSALTGTP